MCPFSSIKNRFQNDNASEPLRAGNPLPFKLSPIPAAGVQRLQLLQRKIFYKTGAVRRPVDFVIMDDDNLAVFVSWTSSSMKSAFISAAISNAANVFSGA